MPRVHVARLELSPISPYQVEEGGSTFLPKGLSAAAPGFWRWIAGTFPLDTPGQASIMAQWVMAQWVMAQSVIAR